MSKSSDATYETYKTTDYVLDGENGYYTNSGLYAVWEYSVRKNEALEQFRFRSLALDPNDGVTPVVESPDAAAMYTREQGTFKKALEASRDELGRSKEGRSLEFYAINTDNDHFTMLAVEHQEGGEVGIAYIDSMGTGGEQVPDEYMKVIQSVYDENKVKQVTIEHSKQQSGSDNGCAIHSCLNAKALAEVAIAHKEHILTVNMVETIKGAVDSFQQLHQSIPDLRTEHLAKGGAFEQYFAAQQKREKEVAEVTAVVEEADRRESQETKENMIEDLRDIASRGFSPKELRAVATNYVKDNQKGWSQARKKNFIEAVENIADNTKRREEDHLFADVEVNDREVMIGDLVAQLLQQQEAISTASIENVVNSFERIDQAKALDTKIRTEGLANIAADDPLYHSLKNANSKEEPMAYTGLGVEAEFVDNNGVKGFKVSAIKKGSSLEGRVGKDEIITHYGVVSEDRKTVLWKEITEEKDYIAIRNAALDNGGLVLKTYDPNRPDGIDTVTCRCTVFGGKQGEGKFSFEGAVKEKQTVMAGQELLAAGVESGNGKNSRQNTSFKDRITQQPNGQTIGGVVRQ